MQFIKDFIIGSVFGAVLALAIYIVFNYGLYILAVVFGIIGFRRIAGFILSFRSRALKVYPMPYRIGA